MDGIKFFRFARVAQSRQGGILKIAAKSEILAILGLAEHLSGRSQD